MKPPEAYAWYTIRPSTLCGAGIRDRWARCLVKDLQYRLDVNSLHRDETADRLGLNEIGRVTLRTTQPLFYDEYRRNRTTGSFILIDEGTNNTVGAGMILGASLLTARGIPATGEYELRTTVAQLVSQSVGAGGSFTEMATWCFSRRNSSTLRERSSPGPPRRLGSFPSSTHGPRPEPPGFD